MELLRFALLAVVIGSASVTGLSIAIDQNECNEGQLYWCDNIRNAKQCNALQHCIHTVWENQVVPKDNGLMCKACLNATWTARSLLTKKLFRKYVEALAKYLCDLITFEESGCEDFSKHIPELTTLLASHIKPKTICSVIGFCNNAKNDQLLEEFQQANNLSSSVITAILSSFHFNHRIDNGQMEILEKSGYQEEDESNSEEKFELVELDADDDDEEETDSL